MKRSKTLISLSLTAALAVTGPLAVATSRSASAASPRAPIFSSNGWEAVASEAFGSISIDGTSEGLAIGNLDQFIAFRVNGVWAPSPFKGQVVGVVGAGLPGATAYVTVGEAENNTDYNGDGDKSDFQLRYAVGSNQLLGTALQVGSDGIVNKSSITYFLGRGGGIGTFTSATSAVQLLPNGVITTTPLTAVPVFIPGLRFLLGTDGAYGEGRYVLRTDGTVVDSGLTGTVVGLVNGIPIVDTAAGRVIASTPPIPIGSSNYAQVWSTGTTAWVESNEASWHADLNADGDLLDPAVCRVTIAGLSRCLSSNLTLNSYLTMWGLGDDAVVLRARDATTTPFPRDGFYFVRGTDPAVFIGTSSDVWALGHNAEMVRTTYLDGAGLERLRWIYVGPNGPSAPVADFSVGSQSRSGVITAHDNQFVMNIPEEATDLNGDGDTNDSISHLVGPTGAVNLKVEADLIGFISNPPARSFEAGGAVAFVVTEAFGDLNGDGDTEDIVAHIVDHGVVTNMRVAIADRQNVFIPNFTDGEQPGQVVSSAPEFFQGTDLNGDGDQLDNLSVVFRRTKTVGAIQPARLLDTRSKIGYTGTKPTAGQTIELQVAGRGGVPTNGIAAVVLNVTVTDATNPGFVTVWGDGAQPSTSNLNIVRAGQTVPNLVLAPVGADGKVRIFTSDGAHIIADAVTWFGAGGAYQPVTPDRLLDTRAGGSVGYKGAKPGPNAIVDVQVVGKAGIVATPGQIVVLNVAAVDATDAGYLTVWGSGAQPDTSNVNIVAVGQTIPNLVAVPVGADGKIRIFTNAGAHLIADVFGTLSGPNVVSNSPRRVLDTRPLAQVGYTGPTPVADQTVAIGLGTPGDIKIINVTATNVTAAGYVTVWPFGPRPDSSNLNPEFRGQSVANLVFAPVGSDGKIRLFTSDGTDLIADVFGTITT
jgi:hypothetical protein